MSSPSNARFGASRGLATVALAVLVVAATGCATSQALHRGQAAERQQDYDRAVVEYSKAVKERPDDVGLRRTLERMKLRAAEEHFTRGRRLAATGRDEEALVELQIASQLNPSNGDIEQALHDVRLRLRTKVAVDRDGKTEIETLINRSRDLPSPGLDLPADVKMPASLVFREASSRDVFLSIGRFAGLNVAFDTTYRDAPLSIELRGVSLADALSAVTASTRTFYRVTAPNTVTIAPDTAAKRREYEEEVIRTFYLGNADLKETIDLLRIVVDNRRISAISATNAIAIKDTPERIAAASRVISAIDKARAEVVIDVELIEVDRTRLKEYGLQIASPGDSPTGIDGSVDVNRDGFTLNDLRNLTQADIFLSGLPSLYYRLLKQDGNTRTLANPQLRTSEGLAAQAKFGERVPVPVTTFTPLASGGVNQQPITSYNYENIGVNIDITPRIHHNDEVSLALNVEVSSISGVGFGGLPTFGNRAIATTIRLKDGETNMLAGLIRDDERQVIRGIPGLSDLPLVGRMFAANRIEQQQTDIILVLTPHIIRVIDLGEADLRPFRVGRQPASVLIERLPSQPEPPPVTEEELPPATPPDSRAAPIRPPAPTPPKPIP